MISTLKLENLQNHVKAKVTFSEGVNYVIGETDKGKSAIIRALRWCLFNKPSNKSMLKRGTKSTSAEVVINGNTIRRERNGNTNRYVVGKKVKSGFGKDVPSEIATLIAMDDSICLQRQGDTYFMLGITSGSERAKALEKFLELSVISESMTRARRTLFAEKKSKQTEKAVIKEIRGELARLKPCLAEIQAVEALQQEGARYASLHTELRLLEENNSNIQLLLSKKTKLEGALAVDLDKVAEIVQGIETVQGEIGLLSDAVRHISTLSPVGDSLKAIEDAEQQYKAYVSEYEAYRGIATQRFYLYELQRQEALLSAELKEIDTAYSKLKVSVCPTCGRKMNENHNRNSRVGHTPNYDTPDMPC